MRTALEWEPLGGHRPLFMVAGLAGKTAQAVREARTVQGLGYHAGLLSLAALKGASEDELVAHCAAVGGGATAGGLLLAAGGRRHPPAACFWQRFADIDNVVAIKMAPFHRYRTLDVIRGVVAAGAEERVTLYTGNDDHIVLDLLAPFTFMRDGAPVTVRIRAACSGTGACGRARAVQLLERIHAAVAAGQAPLDLLALDSQVTDCNAALFDVAHDFHGCIAGCHEVLRRQGCCEGTWCLDPREG
jgi:hypothetical protein